MDICKTDLQLAARLLREAAAYLSAHAKSAREADKARQMNKLSRKFYKRITNEKKKKEKAQIPKYVGNEL